MKKETLPAILAGLLSAGAVVVIYFLGSVFLPLVIALILAFLFDPLVAPLEKRGVNRSLAILLVFSAFLLLAGALAGFFTASLREEFRSVQINLPEYANRLYDVIPPQIKAYFDIETPEKVYAHINKALTDLRGASAEVFKETFVIVKKAFASTLAFILAVLGYLITPVYLYYFLKDLSKLKSGVVGMVPERYRDRFLERSGEINDLLSAFVRGQLSVCAILAVFYSIGLYFIGIDLAVVIGTLAGITFIIPYFGTILGIVLSVTMAILKFHDFLHPLLCVGWFALVQALEGGVITPRIVGDKVGLHPVVTILALLIGGQLFGILGMLLAVPVTAVLKVFSRSLLDYYRNSPYYRGA
ncbi:MAG: hypothetical protein FD174_1528 [Geobacteraceae bacterium]|nr:MAG: hypothetical protein FD174_1528 [Geobacteraceae bacterium]